MIIKVVKRFADGRVYDHEYVNVPDGFNKDQAEIIAFRLVNKRKEKDYTERGSDTYTIDVKQVTPDVCEILLKLS